MEVNLEPGTNAIKIVSYVGDIGYYFDIKSNTYLIAFFNQALMNRITTVYFYIFVFCRHIVYT